MFHNCFPVAKAGCAALAGIAFAVAFAGAIAMAQDIEGSSDHPLVGRYDGAEIRVYAKSDFDRVSLVSAPLPKNFATTGIPDEDTVTVEGKSFQIVYRDPGDRSSLEIDANFKQSLASKGFETVFECFNAECISGSTSYYVFGGLVDDEARNARYGTEIAYRLEKLSAPTGDVYVSILTGRGGDAYSAIRVVETKPMETDRIVFIDAGAMKTGLDQTGHVALYGIYFDTDKSTLKPESAPTLAEIAKLLSANPGLDLIVTGHTDNQGAFDYNVGLSERRAQAVTAALVTGQGVAASRLTPFGAGMSAPVADNDNEAGRALNRRVELVKR